MQTELIVDVITSILGDDVKIYLFGSRAKGNFRNFSDVDIAIDNNVKITPEQLVKIKVELEESPYPYKVDIVDLNNKPDYFDIGKRELLYPKQE